MKPRTRLLVSIGLVLLTAYLVWRGPSLYRLYKHWPLIAACARDNSNCP